MVCSALPGTSVSVSSIWCTWAMASIIVSLSPSCPIGRLRLTMGWRSSSDDQRPDAGRRLPADGHHARAWRADVAPRTGGEDVDDDAVLGRNLRSRLYPVHIS